MKKDFYRVLLALAIPITLQNLITSSINLADVFMIGRLGELELASVGLANQIYFLMILLLFGINSGTGIFISQFWGDKNIKAIHKTMGLSLIVSIIISMFFFGLCQIIPEKLIRIYSPETEVIEVGSNYLRIVSWSYLATSMSFLYGFQLRSVERAKIGVSASVVGLVLNVGVNYILIFGKLGFPALGVTGAAIGTVVARVIESLVILTYVTVIDNPIRSSFKEMMAFNTKFVNKYRITATPVILNELFWSLGITSYSMVYGRMGTSATAVVNIVGSIDRIAFTAIMGLSSAATIMIGKKLGEKDNETAKYYANQLLKLSVLSAVVISIILFTLSKPIVSFYNVDESTYKLILYTMYVLCIAMPLKSINCMVVVGILRAGGDTKFCLLLDTVAMWVMGIPLVAFGGLKLGLPIYLIFALSFSEEIIKSSIGIRRVISGKWINNLAEDFH